MGPFMSGMPSWATTEPSVYSTMEWMMLCGWTSTLDHAPVAMPKSQRASITSSPLFMSVAESMVIFLPMLQFGCFSAWASVTFARSFFANVPEGPARCGQDQLPDVPVRAGMKALKDGAVLAVHRKEPDAAASALGHDQFAGGHQHFFVRQRDVLAGLDRGHGRHQPGGPDNGGDGDVRFFRGRHLDHPLDAGEDRDLKILAPCFSISAAAGLTTDTSDAGLNFRTCCFEQLDCCSPPQARRP